MRWLGVPRRRIRVVSPGLREALERIVKRAYSGSSLTDAFGQEEEYFATELVGEGVRPVIAHAERCPELLQDLAAVEQLFDEIIKLATMAEQRIDERLGVVQPSDK